PRHPASHTPLSMEKLTQVSADITLCPASTISFVADFTKSTVKPDGPNKDSVCLVCGIYRIEH
ncbi:MAG: hypothetical protein LW870_20140, partial [Pirellula sp.]|nr:hypothetical protein [Pirellula sp.]